MQVSGTDAEDLHLYNKGTEQGRVDNSATLGAIIKAGQSNTCVCLFCISVNTVTEVLPKPKANLK